MNERIPILVVLAFLLFTACSPTKKFTKSDRKTVNQLLEHPPLSAHFTGLAVWDVGNKKWVYQKNSKKLFTPASNVKLLTLFSALQMIGDSIPLFEYSIEDKLLHIRGIGNPALFHPEFEVYHPVFNKSLDLQNIDSIIIHEREMKNQRFGPGWSWDDYSYYFQTEINPLPLFGNKLWAVWDSVHHTMHFYPDYVAQFADIHLESDNGPISMKREEFANQFNIKINPGLIDSSVQSVPFLVDPYVQTRIIRDTFHLPVKYSYKSTPREWNSFHYIPTDTILRKMMLESDNFLAEQILLLASGKLGGPLSSQKVIKHIMGKYFPTHKDEVKWVDGSGLSRYNLLSPDFTVEVLNQLEILLSEDDISYYFPVAGRTGTIADWPVDHKQSYIYAKSGELKNNYNLSGYLLTNGDRKLSFSFMNNNYLGTPASLKPSIQEVLNFIKQSY